MGNHFPTQSSDRAIAMFLIRAMHPVARLFARQHELATIAQLTELGVTRGLIRQRVGTGEWERLGVHLVGPSSAPKTWHRTVRAALLTAGDDAAVSDATAGRLHRFDGFDDVDDVHVTSFGLAHRSRFEGTVLHRSRVLTRRACLEVDGLLVVSRPIALMQVARGLGRERAGQALDGMLRAGDSPIWIRQVACAWKGSGVTGPNIVLELLDQRVDGRLPRSWFQRLAKAALSAQGFVLVDEHPVHAADGRLLAELDLAVPELLIGVECQSWLWHATPTGRAADARRKRRLRLLGWELVEVWWSDVQRIDEVAEELDFLIRRRLDRSLP